MALSAHGKLRPTETKSGEEKKSEVDIARIRMRNLEPFGVKVIPMIESETRPHEPAPPLDPVLAERIGRVARRVMVIQVQNTRPQSALD